MHTRYEWGTLDIGPPNTMPQDLQPIIDRIDKSTTLGILLGEPATFDVCASTEVCMRILAEQKKSAALLNPELLAGLAHAELFPTLLTPPAFPKDFIVSVATTSAPIAQLRYEHYDDRVDIILSPKTAALSQEAVSFREGTAAYSCVIALGVADIEAVRVPAGFGPSFFADTTLVAVDVSDKTKSYGDENYIDPSLSALTLAMWRLAQHYKSALDKDSLTLLLAGLFARTEELRNENTSRSAFAAASELMQQGADLARARFLARQTVSTSLLQLFGRASVRCNYETDRRILWSFLTAEDFAKTNRSPNDIPATLAHLQTTFPPQDASVLLWQSPETKEIYASMSGPPSLLEKVRAKEEGTISQGAVVHMPASFDSFRSAETRIAVLLTEML